MRHTVTDGSHLEKMCHTVKYGLHFKEMDHSLKEKCRNVKDWVIFGKVGHIVKLDNIVKNGRI